jgi:hypothetical protein
VNSVYGAWTQRLYQQPLSWSWRWRDREDGRLLQVITFLAVITWTNQFSRAKIMGGNSASRSRLCWHLVRSVAVFCFSFSERDSLVVVALMMFTAYQDGQTDRVYDRGGSYALYLNLNSFYKHKIIKKTVTHYNNRTQRTGNKKHAGTT